MGRPFDAVRPPPLTEQRGETFVRLVALMQRLLAEDGCAWDRAQTFASLRKYVREEACEVVEAIDGGDRNEICSELGDLMFQVVFQAELGRAEGAFGPDDVVAAICEKLVRRHPHVFAEADSSDDAGEMLQSWEAIKAEERKASGASRVLDGIGSSLPALSRAQKIGQRVARVGFDWPDRSGSYAKVTEELAELDAAVNDGDADAMEDEFGDVLFALVNYARHIGVDAETALGRTIGKFGRRFQVVEDRVRAEHGGFPSTGEPALKLELLDEYWNEAKRASRQESK